MLNNILLNKQWVNKEIKEGIKKLQERNQNGNTAMPNLQNFKELCLPPIKVSFHRKHLAPKQGSSDLPGSCPEVAPALCTPGQPSILWGREDSCEPGGVSRCGWKSTRASFSFCARPPGHRRCHLCPFHPPSASFPSPSFTVTICSCFISSLPTPTAPSLPSHP